MMLLNGLLAFVVDFRQRGLDGVGITCAQQLAEKLVVALEGTALVLNAMRQRDSFEHGLVERNAREVVSR